jgi:hypothetical protein
MGFLSATSTIVRLHARPPKNLDRLAIAGAVSERAFRDHDDDGMPRAEAAGWVAIHDPLVTEFDPSDLFFQQYLVVGFRFDTRSVPAKLAWMERRRAEQSRKAELGAERLGRATRREIKEDVESSLLARALPNPKLFECAWNLETEAVYFTGKLKSARQAFATLFRETFGVAPIPMIPYLAAERVGVADDVVDRVREVEPASMVGEVGSPITNGAAPRRGGGAIVKEAFLAVVEAKRFLGREFLTWLVRQPRGRGRARRDRRRSRRAGARQPRRARAGRRSRRPAVAGRRRRHPLRARRRRSGAASCWTAPACRSRAASGVGSSLSTAVC